MKKKSVVLVSFGIILLIVIGVFFYISTGLQIEATVYDAVEKKPIAQASVKIDDKPYFTNTQGRFQSNVPLFGTHYVVVEKNGYKTFKKELNFQTVQKNRKFDVFLEPITFTNLLNIAQKELQSAKSYSFRSTWITNQDEEDETVAYTLYEISSQGVMHFKWLQDDKNGNLIATREMIKTSDFLYYRDNEHTEWQKIDEEKIPPVKLQEPADTLYLFQGTEEPSSFLYDGLDTLFEDPSGKLYLSSELPSSSANEKGKEKDWKEVKVLRYQATWNILNGKRTILFYVGEENLRLYKALLTDNSQPADSVDNNGKMIKNSLSFTLTKLNEEIVITTPEV